MNWKNKGSWKDSRIPGSKEKMMKQVSGIILRHLSSSSGETCLFRCDVWWEWCGGSWRLQLLGAASNEGPGLLHECLPVAMAFSQFHLGELSQCDKMQLKPHDPLS